MVLDHSAGSPDVFFHRAHPLLSSLATSIPTGCTTSSFTLVDERNTSEYYPCSMAIHQNTQVTRLRGARIHQLRCTSSIGQWRECSIAWSNSFSRSSIAHVFDSLIFLADWTNWFFHPSRSSSITHSGEISRHLHGRWEWIFALFSLGADPKKHACYDIDVEVDDPVRDSMRTFLSPQNTHELEELDGKVSPSITSVSLLFTPIYLADFTVDR